MKRGRETDKWRERDGNVREGGLHGGRGRQGEKELVIEQKI